MRRESTMASISTILPPATMKPIIEKGRPPTVITTPAEPLMRTGISFAFGKRAPRSASARQ